MNKELFFLISLTFLMACSTAPVSAQQETAPRVEKKAYDKMLKGLLSHTVHEISVSEAAALQEKAIFLDSRESEEYKVSHIKNSKYVGYDNFDLSSVSSIPKDQKIIVYCSVGYRSEKISEKLIEAGFKDVSNMYGGIFEWKNQDQPVVNENGETENVHAFDRLWGFWLKEGKKVY